MGSRDGSVVFKYLARAADTFRRVCAFLSALVGYGRAILGAIFPGLGSRRRKLRPWMRVRRGARRAGDADLVASNEAAKRLLERMQSLDDVGSLHRLSTTLAGASDDYRAASGDLTKLLDALIRQNPPFLHLALAAPGQGEIATGPVSVEYVERDEELLVTDPCTLYIPQPEVAYREHRRPPGYPMLRTARSLADLRAAPLLYQAMPDDYTISRLVEGAISIMAYREERRIVTFRTEQRFITRRERRHTRVPVEIEAGSAAEGTRLVYVLLDRSASLVRNCKPRGINAVMELAIVLAMLRADLGRPHAHYYLRTFAERLWPLAQDAPLEAVSVQQKEALVQRLLETSFSGEATHVMEALAAAADDLEAMSGGESHVTPSILLITDGRATIYREIGARLRRANIRLDTVLIGHEASWNPELARISNSLSVVDPELFLHMQSIETA